MKIYILITRATILVIALLFLLDVNHSHAGIYNDFRPGGAHFTPSMFINATLAPYVDASPLQTRLIGDDTNFNITGIEADTDNLTAVVGHYDSAFIDVSYSGQILVDVIPGGFEPDTHVYLPYTLQYQTSIGSYDSTNTYNIDPSDLDFNWNTPGSESITISGQIDVDGNISTFDITQSILWSGSGQFNNTFYPEGLILDLSRTSSDTGSVQTIFDQNIDGYDVEFTLDPRPFRFNGRYASGTVPSAVITPEPVSSTLFIIGGATFGFRRFWKNRRNI